MLSVKMKRQLICVLMAIALIISYMPVTAFADDQAPTYPNAAFTITDSTGKKIDLKYDYFNKRFTNFPEEGEQINLFYDGNTSKTPDGTYTYDSSSKRFKNAESDLNLYYGATDYSNKTATLTITRYNTPYISKSGKLVNITSALNVVPVRAPIRTIKIVPSSFVVYYKDIARKMSDGSTKYDFLRRVKHTGLDGTSSWYSRFDVGDKIVITLQDGTQNTYTNQIMYVNNQYRDYFADGSGEYISTKSNEDIVNIGDNTVRVFLYMKSKKIGEVDLSVNVTTERPKEKETGGNNQDSGSDNDNTSSNKVTVPKAESVKVSKNDGKITVSWNKLTKAKKKKVDKIEVQYSTKKNFPKSKTKRKYVSNTKKSFTTAKLKNSTYYIRVRNIRIFNDKKKVSAWSKVKKVKMQ